jgi:large subunit ribosomal protein L25
MSLDTTTLDAQMREKTGKGVAHRLRAEALIPAVVYGPRTQPLNIAVDPKALKRAIQTPHKLNTLITLRLDGGERKALLKDYQQDPVSRALLHADFYEVQMDHKVTVPVPVALVGRPAGAADGGILQQNRRELDVTCLPKDIPEKIDVDVSHLKIAQALHVNEVKPPPGCSIRFLHNFVIALIAVPEREEVAAAAATAAAAPGAAATPAAAAAAPAAAAGAKAAAPAKEAAKAAPAKK